MNFKTLRNQMLEFIVINFADVFANLEGLFVCEYVE